MPAVGLPALLALIGTGVGVGTSVYELANQPSAPKPPTVTPAVTALEQQQTSNAQKAAISQQLPNVLEQTSGLANPDYIAAISQLLAGTAGQSGSSGAAQKLIQQIFGSQGGAPGAGASVPSFTPAGTPQSNAPPGAGTPNFSDFLERAFYA